MRYRFLCCCALALALFVPRSTRAAAPKAGGEINVTVYRFATGKGVSADDAAAATVKLRESLGAIPGYRIIDESNQGVVAVQLLVVGNLSASNGKTTLTVEIIDPATTRVTNSFVRVCAKCDIERLLSLVDEAATSLFRKKIAFTGGRKSAPVAPPLLPPLTDALPEAGAEALMARDAALQAEKAGPRLPAKAAEAWDAVEGVEADNPYREAAKSRAKAWRDFAGANQEFSAQREKDVQKLIGVLRLDSVGIEQKKARLSEFRKAYGSAAADQALASAKLAAETANQLNTFTAEVASQPPGAKLSVDGIAAGVTPWKGQLKTGRHGLRIEAEGYEAQNRELIVVPDYGNAIAVSLKARDKAHWWLQAEAGTLLLPFDLEGRRAEAVDRAGAPDSLAFVTRDGAAGGRPVWIGLQFGKGIVGGGYGYVRQRFSRQSFAPRWINAYGLVIVDEAVVQENRFYVTVNGADKFGPLTLRGGVEAQTGVHNLQAHVLTRGATTLFERTSGLVALGLTGTATVVNLISLGAAVGGEYGAGDAVRPDARVWIAVGYSPWEYR